MTYINFSCFFFFIHFLIDIVDNFRSLFICHWFKLLFNCFLNTIFNLILKFFIDILIDIVNYFFSLVFCHCFQLFFYSSLNTFLNHILQKVRCSNRCWLNLLFFQLNVVYFWILISRYMPLSFCHNSSGKIIVFWVLLFINKVFNMIQFRLFYLIFKVVFKRFLVVCNDFIFFFLSFLVQRVFYSLFHFFPVQCELFKLIIDLMLISGSIFFDWVTVDRVIFLRLITRCFIRGQIIKRIIPSWLCLIFFRWSFL